MKVGYVLLDGCADRPNPLLNFTTPLEAAYTPNLDEIARRSKLGRVVTVGRGIAPESDIAVFNMLGYSFDEGYPGRGVIEAVGSDLEVADGDLALRANLASVRGRRWGSSCPTFRIPCKRRREAIRRGSPTVKC
jgi:2,3-bisphosphoglycerate-independent phosphoglycerate mutase